MSMDAERIGVLVAEDNRDLCDAVCALIDAEPDMRITGTATRVSELLDGARAASARVLVLDLDLGGESSVPALQTLRAQQPQLAVVVFSGNDRDTLAPVFAGIGRCEYVMKTGDVLPLLDAIRRVAQN
jgi:DNA-binding NarL/FixJ family response regulator